MNIIKLCTNSKMHHFTWPVEGIVLSAVVSNELDIERIEDMLTEAVAEDGFQEYFDADWFPLVKAKDLPTAISQLEAKAKHINHFDANLVRATLLAHWQCIEDNFKWNVPVTMQSALEQQLRLCSKV